MKQLTTLLFVLSFCGLIAQEDNSVKSNYHDGGHFNLGLRTTTSLFSSDGNAGMGVGGQFRLGLTPWLNTEWFLDYISADLSGYGKRTDAHIGWSVLFYPVKFKKASFIQPYIIAGHCFDYTKMRSNNYTLVNYDDETEDRWSSAIQGGIGFHLHASKNIDFSFNGQYMWHLGQSIGVEVNEDEPPGVNPIHIHGQDSGDVFEGHLLITFSMNIKIADLW